MNVKVVINVKETSKEDIKAFVQMIREWELKTPQATICGVLFDTDPKITSEEARQIFEGVFPEFEHLVEMPAARSPLLRLGARGIVAQGKLVGTCDELTLMIEKATEEDIKMLQDAQAISLVRIQKG